jgi:phosphoribosylglycinamide formyltransferase-1
MRRLALFLSGTGGNAVNLVRACRSGAVAAEPVLGLASSPRAGGIARLEAEGLPVAVVPRPAFADDGAFSEACYREAEAAGADVIVLCGWLKRLEVPARWAGRILNIHPGLLPAFGGAGMYGMHVHRAVLAAGCSESGCTVHLVDNVYDHGEVLGVAKVPVLPGDTPEALQARVYGQEMALYPRILADFLARSASGR